jgi:hypothetical protein
MGRTASCYRILDEQKANRYHRSDGGGCNRLIGISVEILVGRRNNSATNLFDSKGREESEKMGWLG